MPTELALITSAASGIGWRPQRSKGRMATATEAAQAIAYLASDCAAFITGSVLVIDGGLTAGLMATDSR